MVAAEVLQNHESVIAFLRGSPVIQDSTNFPLRKQDEARAIFVVLESNTFFVML